jgi:hypothetical protein
MPHASLSNQDWQVIVDRLGGAKAIGTLARQTRAFLRARGIATAVDLLRLLLSYCLGDRGLRSTAAWASAVGLADISNVAVLYRLRHCGDWLAALVSQVLAGAVPPAGRGRMIRLIDATAPRCHRKGHSPGNAIMSGASTAPSSCPPSGLAALC